jgi:hypothetical protein
MSRSWKGRVAHTILSLPLLLWDLCYEWKLMVRWFCPHMLGLLHVGYSLYPRVGEGNSFSCYITWNIPVGKTIVLWLEPGDIPVFSIAFTWSRASIAPKGKPGHKISQTSAMLIKLNRFSWINASGFSAYLKVNI